jgi:hypothetical protein
VLHGELLKPGSKNEGDAQNLDQNKPRPQRVKAKKLRRRWAILYSFSRNCVVLLEAVASGKKSLQPGWTSPAEPGV